MEYYQFFRHGADVQDAPRERKWRLVNITQDLAKLRAEFQNTDLFLSLQTYGDSQVSTEETAGSAIKYNLIKSDDCPYLISLYFDLDHNSDTNVARVDAIKLYDFLVKDMFVPESEIQVYFSGKKGFHVLVDFRSLGIKMRSDWHLVYKRFAKDIMRMCSIRSLDLSVYSRRRVLRLPDSKHTDTGLFKVEITRSELENGMEYIMDAAKAPRGAMTISSHVPDACQYIRLVLDEYVNQLEVEKLHEETTAPELIAEVIRQNPSPPVCISDLLARHIWKEGDRNHATMCLASYYRCAGVPIPEAIEEICKWASDIPKNLTSTHGRHLWLNTKSVVETVYAMPDKYSFKCPFILSLGTPNDRVRCNRLSCPISDENIAKNQPAKELPLHSVFKAENAGKKIKTKCIIATKPDRPMMVPSKFRCTCMGAEDCKKQCQLGSGAPYERTLNSGDKKLLALCHAAAECHRSILSSDLHNGNCKKMFLEILDHVNIFDFEVTSNVEKPKMYQRAEDAKTEKTPQTSMFIYLISNEIPEVNATYNIEGFLYAHPKDNRTVLLVDSLESVQSDLDKFVMTPEINSSFNILRAKGNTAMDVLQKALQIADVLSKESIHINARNDLVLAILLTFHSVVQFPFLKNVAPRGWVEILIIGDSGEGKSMATQAIIDHVGLGTCVSGESTKRTGLTYAIEQTGKRWVLRWGVNILMDRQLFALDETSEVAAEDLGQLTEGRSSGVINVDKMVRGRAFCRTRKIFMSNPRSGRQVSQFTYPIEAVNDVFASHADVRRLCMAVIVAKNDINAQDININTRDFVKDDGMKCLGEDLMRNSVLHAWSRTAMQVEITPEAEDAILDNAIQFWYRYQHETIELISKGDTKDKLARLSVALASLVKSTDEDGHKILVRTEHVEAVCMYLQNLYDSYSLDAASAKFKQRNCDVEIPRNDGETKLAYDLRKGKLAYGQIYDIAKGIFHDDTETIKMILNIMSDMPKYSIQDITACANLEKDLIGDLFSKLMKNGFITYGSNGKTKDVYYGTAKMKLAFRYKSYEEMVPAAGSKKMRDVSQLDMSKMKDELRAEAAQEAAEQGPPEPGVIVQNPQIPPMVNPKLGKLPPVPKTRAKKGE